MMKVLDLPIPVESLASLVDQIMEKRGYVPQSP